MAIITNNLFSATRKTMALLKWVAMAVVIFGVDYELWLSFGLLPHFVISEVDFDFALVCFHIFWFVAWYCCCCYGCWIERVFFRLFQHLSVQSAYTHLYHTYVFGWCVCVLIPLRMCICALYKGLGPIPCQPNVHPCLLVLHQKSSCDTEIEIQVYYYLFLLFL